MAGPGTAFQAGDHASRPANGAGCILYACSTHSLIYVDDGSSWSTWAASAGSSGWTAIITDDLSTMDNVTVVDGTWADAGAYLQQTAATSFRLLKHDTKVYRGTYAVECEVRIPTQGNAEPHAGVVANWNGTETPTAGASMVAATLRRQASSGAPTSVRLHRSSATFIETAVGGLAIDTWYTIRLYVTGTRYVVTLDGTEINSATFAPQSDGYNSIVVGLIGFQTGDFRNFRVIAPALAT